VSAFVALDGVSHTYSARGGSAEGTLAVDGLSLSIEAGEFVAVVGPSGSGKSTMMMVMDGLERASAGDVRIAGQDLGALDEDGLALFRRRRVGIVFQGFHLIPTMTARENVAVPLEFAGAWGAFAVQNTWTAGVEGEEPQGHRFAKVARDAGVQHFVYTSFGSADRQTGIPHFDNKFRVENTVRALNFPSYAIIRPVFFMENLVSPWFLNGDTLVSTLKTDTVLQMIAVKDIGQYGAMAFTQADRFKNVEVDIAGDAVTLPQAAATLSQAYGRTIEYLQIPISEVRKNSEDFALMLEWFDRVGYDADIAGNAKEYGIKPTTLKEWSGQLR